MTNLWIDNPRQTPLKVRLPNPLAHPGARCSGCPVQAVVAAGDSQTSSGLRPWLDAIDLVTHTPLRGIKVVQNARSSRQRDAMNCEVAR